MQHNVALFITCLTDQFYPRVGIAVTKILEHLNCRVHFPEAQTCCGNPSSTTASPPNPATSPNATSRSSNLTTTS